MKQVQRLTCLTITVLCLTCIYCPPLEAQNRDRIRGNMSRDGACFYRDAGYRGDYFCVNSGETLWNIGHRFNDEISSIRIFGRSRVVVFEHENFRGAHRVFYGNVPNLYRHFNDKITSIEVQSDRNIRDGYSAPNSSYGSPRRVYPPR
jgi:hypothetical protein